MRFSNNNNNFCRKKKTWILSDSAHSPTPGPIKNPITAFHLRVTWPRWFRRGSAHRPLVVSGPEASDRSGRFVRDAAGGGRRESGRGATKRLRSRKRSRGSERTWFGDTAEPNTEQNRLPSFTRTSTHLWVSLCVSLHVSMFCWSLKLKIKTQNAGKFGASPVGTLVRLGSDGRFLF